MAGPNPRETLNRLLEGVPADNPDAVKAALEIASDHQRHIDDCDETPADRAEVEDEE